MSTSLFASLTPEVASVLEVVNEAEVAASLQTKRKLVQAVSMTRHVCTSQPAYYSYSQIPSRITSTMPAILRITCREARTRSLNRKKLQRCLIT